MAMFGTGPFDSDGALDLIEDLADWPAAERADMLGELLGFALGNPTLCGSEFFPHEIVAATALVAAGLPDGADVRSGLASVAPSTVVPAADAVLAQVALAALASVADAWGACWTTAAEMRAARRTVERLAQILHAAARG